MTKHKIFLLLILSFKAYSQSHEVSCSKSPYLSFEAKNVKTYPYSPVFVAKKAYSSLKEVTNAFPEALIESEMSVISQEWSSFNYGKTRAAEPKRYALNQKVDVSKNGKAPNLLFFLIISHLPKMSIKNSLFALNRHIIHLFLKS